MKYNIILLILISNMSYAMQENTKKVTPEKSRQEIEMLKRLADERSNLSFKDFQDSLLVSKKLVRQENNLLVTKALWGIARACHDSYAPDSLALAETLIQAGADPYIKIRVEDILSLRCKEEGKGFSYTSVDYETTVIETATGSLKKYLEARPKN